MKFENRGRWLKEAQDKMAARDTMEDPDFLDGDDKVLTFEEEELDMEDDDNFEDAEGETIGESAQKNEDFKKPKTHEELKAGEWYEVEGKLFQIADRQPIDNEVQAFRVQPDYSVGNGVHVLYKSFYKPEKFKFVDKRDTLTKIIKEKEAQIAKLKQEIDALKRSL